MSLVDGGDTSNQGIEVGRPVDIFSLPKDTVLEFASLHLLVECIRRSRGLVNRIGQSDVRVRVKDIERLKNHGRLFRPIKLIGNQPFFLPIHRISSQINGPYVGEIPKNNRGMYEVVVKGSTEMDNWGLPMPTERVDRDSRIPEAEKWFHTNKFGLSRILDSYGVYGSTFKGGIETRFYSVSDNYESVITDDKPIAYGSIDNGLPIIREKGLFKVFPQLEPPFVDFCYPEQYSAMKISRKFRFENYFDEVVEPSPNTDLLKEMFLEGKAIGLITLGRLTSLLAKFGAHQDILFQPKITRNGTVWPITLFTADNKKISQAGIVEAEYLLAIKRVADLTNNKLPGAHRLTREEIDHPAPVNLTYELTVVDAYSPGTPRTYTIGIEKHYIIKLNFNPFKKP